MVTAIEEGAQGAKTETGRPAWAWDRLAVKVSAVAAAFTLLLSGSVATLSFLSAEQSLTTAAEGILRSTSQQHQIAVRAWLDKGPSLLGSLSQIPSVVGLVTEARDQETPQAPNAFSSGARLTRFLNRWTDGTGFFANALIADALDGQILAATSTDAAESEVAGKDIGTTPAFRAGLETAGIRPATGTGLAAGALVASGPLRSADGDLLAVVVAEIDPSRFSQALPAHLVDQSAMGASTLLLDGSKVLMSNAGPDVEAALVRGGVLQSLTNTCTASGVVDMETVGEPSLGSMIATGTRLTEQGLCLLVLLDRDTLMAPLTRYGQTILWLAALGALVAILTAIALTVRAVRPIVALSEAASTVAQGDLSVRVPVTRSGDEITSLGRDFNAMVEAIVAREQTIEETAGEKARLAATVAVQQNLLNTITGASPDIICLFDQSGACTFLNNAARRAWCVDHTQLADLTLLNHGIDPSIAIRIDTEVANVLRGEEIDDVEIESRDADGGSTVHWFRFSPIAGPGPQPDGVLCVGRDVTRNHRRQQKIEDLARRLETSNEELQRFAYVASHDLQEPLRKIASFCKLLERQYGDAFDEKGSRFLNYVVDGATRMQQLINDLLALSRIETRANPFLPVRTDEVVTSVIGDLSMLIRDTGADIQVGPLPTLAGDARQLSQLFQNLIANAIRYRGSEPPRITIGAAFRDDVWEFSVKDNGIGIDPQYHDRIFLMFQRLHTRTDYPNGTGIGLAICKRIVDRHGGRIWVVSEAGAGADFRFTIPPEIDKDQARLEEITDERSAN